MRAKAFGSRVDHLRLLSHAKTAARQAGRTVTERTLKRWAQGRAFLSKKSLAQLEAAYLQVRRHSVARHLLQRLNRDGRGTRVEFHPLSQSRVSRPHHGAVTHTLKLEIAAPGVDISAAMDEVWFDGIAIDLGFAYGVYEYVTIIGFAV
ncbi:transcriptional regulator [Streptomyces sp. NPDC058686]|uniref:transcriptional regulator n=1 Tax=Streptomyces sp. NPDC058686 TaxID=3346599 RepID=UPI003660183F